MKDTPTSPTADSTAGAPGAASAKVPWAGMSILFFAHFVVDSQMSFLAPLIPLLREKLHFTLTSAGVLISIHTMSSALSQPITSIVVDRWPWMPWLVVGIVGSSVALTAIGWLPSYTGIAVALSIGGILSGLCHPDMASRAGGLSDAHRSLSVSFFVTGGRLGFAFGPIIAIAVAEQWGMEWLWTYIFVGIVCVLTIQLGLPVPVRSTEKKKEADGRESLWEAVKRARLPLAMITGIAVSRACINVNLAGFLPTLFVDKGLGLWSGGFANSVIFFAGAFGVMLGGIGGDRYGRRNVIAMGMALGFSGMVGFLLAPISYAFFFLSIVGVGIFIPMGVSVALSQEYLPHHRGFASSLTLGMGWMLASLTVYPLTFVAERIGLERTFWALPFVLAIGFVFAIALPRDRAAD